RKLKRFLIRSCRSRIVAGRSYIFWTHGIFRPTALDCRFPIILLPHLHSSHYGRIRVLLTYLRLNCEAPWRYLLFVSAATFGSLHKYNVQSSPSVSSPFVLIKSF